MFAAIYLPLQACKQASKWLLCRMNVWIYGRELSQNTPYPTNCFRGLGRRGRKRGEAELELCGFHALPAPEIYTSEYMVAYPGSTADKKQLT